MCWPVWGGDEFAVILYRCNREQALERASRLCSTIADYRYLEDGRQFQLGVSIGLASITGSAPATEVLRQADAACYMAKQNGRNQVHAYHEEDAGLERAQRELQWLPLLQEALEKRFFTLYIQPIESLCRPVQWALLRSIAALRQCRGRAYDPGPLHGHCRALRADACH